ncbi:MAG: hypothetical protein ACK41C_03380 [Phenylobacterium sp.]|uniref:hypothetical protein n=1 Tax=Phenylobacterium sp. TaxID=1871053 RepID=UPI00391D9FC3
MHTTRSSLAGGLSGSPLRRQRPPGLRRILILVAALGFASGVALEVADRQAPPQPATSGPLSYLPG